MTLKYVPEHLRTTEYYLFEDRYLCSIKTIDMYSTEYIKEFGLYGTGDKEIDNAYLNERQQVHLTINEMLEYYKNGVTIGLCTPGDSKKVYDRISNHLNRWINELEKGLGANVAKAPIDDLIALDEFASVVYEHAVRLFERTRSGTKLGSLINSIAPNGRLLMQTPVTPVEGQSEAAKNGFPERMSMGSLFNNFKGTSFYSLNPTDEEDSEDGI